MANVKITLGSEKRINNVNVYSDIDVTSKNMAKNVYDRESIKSSINNILTWKQYERILNPDFGNSLWSTIFENINGLTKNNIVNYVKNMLNYEPRIKVKNIDVTANASSNEIIISFSYTIPSLDEIEEQYEITISKQ